MSFAARAERRGAAAIVRLEGELDIAAEAEATAELERAIDGAEVLIADLRGLAFADSTGVRVLLAADLTAREHGVRFAVACADGVVGRLLEVTQVSRRFPVIEDPEELVEG